MKREEHDSVSFKYIDVLNLSITSRSVWILSDHKNVVELIYRHTSASMSVVDNIGKKKIACLTLVRDLSPLRAV